MVCGQSIDIDRKEEFGATTHFIADQHDPLYRYSDAAFHRSCFLSWEHRDEFSAKYEKVMGRKVAEFD
jgi:hypothetical protein